MPDERIALLSTWLEAHHLKLILDTDPPHWGGGARIYLCDDRETGVGSTIGGLPILETFYDEVPE